LQEVIDHKKEKYLITGVGINTKISPLSKDFKSTSLKINSSKNISNKIIIDKIMKNYDKLIYDINYQNAFYIRKKYK
jgi:biotin-(acetyl-CoA carboxylase) ligase